MICFLFPQLLHKQHWKARCLVWLSAYYQKLLCLFTESRCVHSSLSWHEPTLFEWQSLLVLCSLFKCVHLLLSCLQPRTFLAQPSGLCHLATLPIHRNRSDRMAANLVWSACLQAQYLWRIECYSDFPSRQSRLVARASSDSHQLRSDRNAHRTSRSRSQTFCECLLK